jgi:hypothetical protein
MPEYVLLIGGGDFDGLSPAEMEAAHGKFMDFNKYLRENGRYLEGVQLAPAGKYITGNPPVSSDGPFAESKEVVGGYFKYTAANLDEALEIAKRCPGTLYGGKMELRPTTNHGGT